MLVDDTSVSHPCLPETHLLHESNDSRLPMLYTTITAEAFSYCAIQPASVKSQNRKRLFGHSLTYLVFRSSWLNID
jgi:hypothetical protein